MNTLRAEAKGFKELCRDQIVIRLPFELRRNLEKKAREKGLRLSKLIRLYLEKGLTEEK
jgi:predicted DNA binding CopG/RHH family protein